MPSEQERRRLGFRQTVALAIAALSVAVIGLTLANIAKGPRLLGVQVNPRAAVEQAGQLLILQTDQVLTGVEPSRVSVAPAVPVEVSSRGATVEVRFVGALRYSTEYRVSAAVSSAATGAGSTLVHKFRTPAAEVYVLQRKASAVEETSDHIVRTIPGSAERKVVYSAARIQEFAVSGPSLAVITQDASSAGTLSVGPVNGSGPWKTLATDSVVSQLQASTADGVFGFVLQPLIGPAQERIQLQLYDPAVGRLTGVMGLDGKPLDPQSWAFVPGTRTIVAQTADALFFLIDSLTGSVKPLGGHSRMHGFVNGTPTLILESDGHYAEFDLTAGRSTDIPLGDLLRSALVYRLLALPDHSFVSLIARFEDGALRYSIVAISHGTFKTIYAPGRTDSAIDALCLSPNGQLLALDVVPAGTEADGYEVVTGYRDSRVVVIDSSTGSLQGDEAGFGASWCN